MTLERQTLHVMDDKQRVALVETITIDASAAPTALPAVTQRYQFGNHLGTALLELDETAAVLTYEEYYPFGSTSYQAGASVAEVSLKRYRYTGKERDTETGLYYYGARYYAPWIGRWTACDPIGIKDGPNLYAYCRNNPIVMHDPTGTDGQKPPDTTGLSNTGWEEISRELHKAAEKAAHLQPKLRPHIPVAPPAPRLTLPKQLPATPLQPGPLKLELSQLDPPRWSFVRDSADNDNWDNDDDNQDKKDDSVKDKDKGTTPVKKQDDDDDDKVKLGVDFSAQYNPGDWSKNAAGRWTNLPSAELQLVFLARNASLHTWKGLPHLDELSIFKEPSGLADFKYHGKNDAGDYADPPLFAFQVNLLNLAWKRGSSDFIELGFPGQFGVDLSGTLKGQQALELDIHLDPALKKLTSQKVTFFGTGSFGGTAWSPDPGQRVKGVSSLGAGFGLKGSW